MALALTLFLAAPDRFALFLAFAVPGAVLGPAAGLLLPALLAAAPLAFLLAGFFLVAAFLGAPEAEAEPPEFVLLGCPERAGFDSEPGFD